MIVPNSDRNYCNCYNRYNPVGFHLRKDLLELLKASGCNNYSFPSSPNLNMNPGTKLGCTCPAHPPQPATQEGSNFCRSKCSFIPSAYSCQARSGGREIKLLNNSAYHFTTLRFCIWHCLLMSKSGVLSRNDMGAVLGRWNATAVWGWLDIGSVVMNPNPFPCGSRFFLVVAKAQQAELVGKLADFQQISFIWNRRMCLTFCQIIFITNNLPPLLLLKPTVRIHR